MSAPDLTVKVIGFRQWSHTDRDREPSDEDLGLWASHATYWAPGVNTARCRELEFESWRLSYGWSGENPRPRPPSNHAPPHPLCTCGLYAEYDASGWVQRGIPHGAIVGAVAAWGRIEAHKAVFRAQYAEPVVLAYDPQRGPRETRICGEVAERYGLRLVTIDELEEAAREFGQPMPTQFRGAEKPPAQPAVTGLLPAAEPEPEPEPEPALKPESKRRKSRGFTVLYASLAVANGCLFAWSGQHWLSLFAALLVVAICAVLSW